MHQQIASYTNPTEEPLTIGFIVDVLYAHGVHQIYAGPMTCLVC